MVGTNAWLHHTHVLVIALVCAFPASAQKFELKMGSRTDSYTVARCMLSRETNSDFHEAEIYRAKISEVQCTMVPTKDDATIPLGFSCACSNGSNCLIPENVPDKKPVPDIFLLFNAEYGPENRPAINSGLRLIANEKKRCSP
jgi:hypothetical protein